MFKWLGQFVSNTAAGMGGLFSFRAWGEFVARFAWLVVLFWLAAVLSVWWFAPPWDSVTQDGDLAYLPDEMPSVQAEELLRKYFPDQRSRSQVVISLIRERQVNDRGEVVQKAGLTSEDLTNFDFLAARYHNHLAAKLLAEARAEPGELPLPPASDRDDENPTRQRKFLDAAMASADEGAILAETLIGAVERRIDRSAAVGDRQESTEVDAILQAQLAEARRLYALATWNLSIAAKLLGDDDKAESERVEALLDAPGGAGLLENAPRRETHNFAALYWRIAEQLAATDFEAESKYRRAALALEPRLNDAEWRKALLEPLPLVDVWTRHTEFLNEKLVSKGLTADGQPRESGPTRAQLLVLPMSNEFLATANVGVIHRIEHDVDEFFARLTPARQAGLEYAISGSAAVGGDMLRAAQQAISNTEVLAVVLVLIILLFVYRSPLLIAVPLITIVVSLVIGSGLVAWLTQVGQLEGFDWYTFKVFKTTRIFIVVILYGAGTDYCLFLIARYREELEQGADLADGVAGSLLGVGDALAASALTTVFGLAMMFFADFGKFSNSGPAIGVCLVVTLLAALTLAPALLRIMGRAAFWPWSPPSPETRLGPQEEFGSGLWRTLARWVVRYPGPILVGSVLLLAPLAVSGAYVGVTYNFLGELRPQATSRQGTDRLGDYFPVGESGPIVVVAERVDGGFDEPPNDSGREILRLTKELYGDAYASELPDAAGEIRPDREPTPEEIRRGQDVEYVRSSEAPLGRRPPPGGEEATVGARRIYRSSDRVRNMYLTPVAESRGDVIRFEVILKHQPFSYEAVEALDRLEAFLERKARDPDSFWYDATFVYGGTTSSLRDLREVTESDTFWIKIWVVLAVFLVILLIIRKPITCLFMMGSVLFSYYVTIGATEWFFYWAYGDTYEGLDWKVPLFLFVILVAVGQDYNIYLATRVFEEQEARGKFRGLHSGLVQTGGIITSCGVIMAGTFISMASGPVLGQLDPLIQSQFPSSEVNFSSGTLRGMTELGFSLSLGVMLDTFVVRPILLPAFLALMAYADDWLQE